MTVADPWAVHDDACRRGEVTYVDPRSGYQVFTAVGLKQRGRCCGSGCRHCPFAHEAVPLEGRAARIHQPAWLGPPPRLDEPKVVLFWSGGKDSFLAFRALCRAGCGERIVALTTFDGATRRVAHQEVAIDTVVAQARTLGLPLLGVPLQPAKPYRQQVSAGLDLLERMDALAFGDLHLAHIRHWRERELGPLLESRGARLDFPLWRAEYPVLLDDLAASGAACHISAVEHPALGHVRVGDVFDRAFVERLPAAVDGFGENGEFHTVISPQPPAAALPVYRRS